MDTAIRSQASQLGVVLNVVADYCFPQEGGYLVTAAKCEIQGDPAKYPAVAQIVRTAMRPADMRTIEGWLAELSVIVIRRQDDEFTEELRLEAFAARLTRYPADVAHHALLVRTWKFWPAWEELEKECESLVKPRRAMLRELEAPRQQQPSDTRGTRVAADRAAEIMEEAGFRPKRFGAVEVGPEGQPREAEVKREAVAKREPEPVKDWTKDLPPDHPRRQELERSRANNPLIQQAKQDAERAKMKKAS